MYIQYVCTLRTCMCSLSVELTRIPMSSSLRTCPIQTNAAQSFQIQCTPRGMYSVHPNFQKIHPKGQNQKSDAVLEQRECRSTTDRMTTDRMEYLEIAPGRKYSVKYVQAGPAVPLAILGRCMGSVFRKMLPASCFPAFLFPISCFLLPASCFLLPASCCFLLLGWKSITQLMVSVPSRLLFSASRGIFSATLVRDTVISGTEGALSRGWVVQGHRDPFFFFFPLILGPKDQGTAQTGTGGGWKQADYELMELASTLHVGCPRRPAKVWYRIARMYCRYKYSTYSMVCRGSCSTIPYGTVIGSSGAELEKLTAASRTELMTGWKTIAI